MTQSLVDRATLDDLAAVIGAEKLARLVDRFAANLVTAFEGGERTPADHAREAHTLISMSGMLGCERLSQACRGLEHAAKAGDDLTPVLHEVLSLRDATVTALRQVRVEAGADR